MLLGLNGKIGCLGTAAAADLIGVAGDPLDHIAAIADAANVKLVLKAGGVVNKQAADRQALD